MQKIQNKKSKRLSPALQVCKKQNRIINCDVVYDSRCDKSRNVVLDGMSTTGDRLNVPHSGVHFKKTFNKTVEYPILKESIFSVQHASDREQRQQKLVQIGNMVLLLQMWFYNYGPRVTARMQMLKKYRIQNLT